MLALILLTVAATTEPCGPNAAHVSAGFAPVTLALQACPQEPRTRATLAAAAGSEASDALVVVGTPELSRREALAAAQEQARVELLERLAARGRTTVGEAAPAWLPGFVQQRIVARWLQGLDSGKLQRVTGEDFVVRDHGFAQSYEARLLVEEDAAAVQHSLRSLRVRLADSGRWFAAAAGGLVVFWAVLALVQAWFDRLTRGYMTWRLRLIAAAIGAVPLTLLLLV